MKFPTYLYPQEMTNAPFRFEREEHEHRAPLTPTPGTQSAQRFVAGRVGISLEHDAEAQRALLRSAEGAAQGLVSLSTTCKGDLVIDFMAENAIEIDHQKARLTRMRKSIGVAAKALHNLGPKNQRVWMLTLTYKGTNANWRPEHVSRFLDGLRRWHYSRTGSKKIRYVWVAELQQRGVIHYHVCVWLPDGLTPPKPDRAWRLKGVMQPAMWPHGMSNRLEAFAPVAYLMKYASKDTSKEGAFPRGARIHGCGGLDEVGRGCRRWVLWPAYVQGNAAITDRFRPAKGGGYVNADTGEYLPSEYVPTGGGFRRFVRIRFTPRSVPDAGGPFSWLH